MKITLSYNEIKEIIKNRFDLPFDFQYESQNTVVIVYVPLNVRVQLSVDGIRDNIISMSYKGMSLKDNLALNIAVPAISSKMPNEIIDILPKINKVYLNLNGIPNSGKILNAVEPQNIAFNEETIELKVAAKSYI